MIEKSSYKPTNKRIYDYMKESNNNFTNDTALTYFNNRISYGDFFKVIDKAATSFTMVGIRKGDYVTICTPNIPQGVISFYALNKIGAVPDMLPVMASDEEFKEYLKAVPSKAIVLFNELYSRLKSIIADTELKNIIIVSPTSYVGKGFDVSINKKIELIWKEVKNSGVTNKNVLSWKKFLKLSDGQPNVESSILLNNETALLSHTGGSTGFPKAAEMTNENFNAMVEQFKLLNFDIKRNYKILTILPIFINYGLCSNVHMPLCLGVETIIVPTFSEDEAQQLFSNYKPNIFMCVADYFEKMLDDEKFNNMDLSFLKLVVYGGAPMKEEKKEQFNNWLNAHGAKGVKIMNGYGMTEACATILTERCPVGQSTYKLMRLPDVRIKTIDPDTEEDIGFEKEGELLASGPTIFKGYYENVEETKNVFIIDKDNVKWLRTGDMAIIHEDDEVEIVGRIKRMLPVVDITNGSVAKLYPDNIEKTIEKSAFARKAICVCMENSIRVNIPFSYVWLKDNINESEALQDIKLYCKELNSYSRPYHIFFIDEVKYNKSNKVDLQYYESLLDDIDLNNFTEESYD